MLRKLRSHGSDPGSLIPKLAVFTVTGSEISKNVCNAVSVQTAMLNSVSVKEKSYEKWFVCLFVLEEGRSRIGKHR